MKLSDLLKLTDFVTVPLSVSLLSTRILWGGGNLLAIAAALLFGLVLWTFAEYWVHRFAHSALIKEVRFQHLQHHADPGALVGGTLYSTIIILSLCLIGMVWASATIAGLLCGYLWFITLHFVHHHAPRLAALRPHLQGHHAVHHHFNPDRCFGVTTTIWDHLFGTADLVAPISRGDRER